MPIKVAVISTVAAVSAVFPKWIREAIPDAVVYSLLDEYLVTEFQRTNNFTPNCLSRLHAVLTSADRTDADAIIVTCSTMSPGVELFRPLIAKHLLTIDGAMLRRAGEIGDKITLIGTAPSAVNPAAETLRREAAEREAKLDLEVVIVDDALFGAGPAYDIEARNRAIVERASKVRERDVIILGQASMAVLAEPVKKATGIEVLTSPGCCLEELKRILGA
ncbi:MAG: aspartate/glutamate racemase family protein [Planctomycetes bacterium]|nr:aspartate/glutamate racemase family protein [Planctomycetota bacterium]